MDLITSIGIFTGIVVLGIIGYFVYTKFIKKTTNLEFSDLVEGGGIEFNEPVSRPQLIEKAKGKNLKKQTESLKVDRTYNFETPSDFSLLVSMDKDGYFSMQVGNKAGELIHSIDVAEGHAIVDNVEYRNVINDGDSLFVIVFRFDGIYFNAKRLCHLIAPVYKINTDGKNVARITYTRVDGN